VNCERCGEHPAEIPYTEVREGRVEKLRICRQCARSLGFAVEDEPSSGGTSASRESPAPPTDETEGGKPAGKPLEDADPLGARRCPLCGLTGDRLREESLFGCPRCYEVFAEALEPLFRRIHGAVLHRGRLPGGIRPPETDPEDLRRRLREALQHEDYEEAARLRDRLRAGGGSRGEPEDPA
jgi:protein arginine kinase activator